jgi:hypothetical protein
MDSRSTDPFSATRTSSYVVLGALGLRLLYSLSFFVMPREVLREMSGGLRQTMASGFNAVMVITTMVWLGLLFSGIRKSGQRTAWSPALAVFSFLIPFANFVMPALAVQQAWKVRAPNKSVAIVWAWWGVYVVYTILNLLSSARIAVPIPYFGLLVLLALVGLWGTVVYTLGIASGPQPSQQHAFPAPSILSVPPAPSRAPDPNVVLPSRTVAEIHLFLDLEGCSRDRRHALVERNGALVAVYQTSINGQPVSYAFEPQEMAPSANAYGNGVSRLLTPGDFLYESHRLARSNQLLQAADCLDQILRFIRPGERLPPQESLKSARDRYLLQTSVGELDAERIAAVAASYRRSASAIAA